MRTSWRVLRLLGISIAGWASAADMPRAALRIPRLPSPPVVDGRIAEREWDAAAGIGVFQLVRTLGTTRTRQQAWLGWDQERLYVAFRTWGESPDDLVTTAGGRDGGVWKDDAFELHVALGDTGRRIQFVGNCGGTLYDASNGDSTWNAPWLYRASRTDSGWQAELAVSWNDAGCRPPAPGDSWRFLICHDDADAVRASEVSAWAPISTNFHDVDAYAHATFVDGTVAAGAVDVTRTGETAGLHVRVSVGGDTPGEVACALEGDGLSGATTTIIPARSEAKVAVLPLPLPLPEGSRGVLRVRDDAGIELLCQPIPLDVRRPVTVAFGNMLVVGRMSFDVVGPPQSEGTAEYRIETRTRQAVLTGETTVQAGRASMHVDCAELPPGAYRVHLDVSLPGRGVHETFFWPVEQPERPAWMDTEAGLTDAPLPPFTTVTVRGERLFCWGRSYEFQDAWLPTGIVSADEQILAAPMRLVARVEGREIDLSRIPMAAQSQRPNRIETTAAGQADGLLVNARAWMEEDGFWWVTVALSGDETSVLESLLLEMPVRRSIARYIHPCNGAWSTTSGTLPESGWSGRFWPVVSLVNDDKGVAWYCESTAGWRPSDPKAVMRVDVDERAAVLRCEVIGRPTAIGKGLSYSFGVQACPVKAIPTDWRSRRFIHGARFGMEDTLGHDGGSLTYPALGRIDFAQGTIEAWVRPMFDPNVELKTRQGQEAYNNTFLQVGPEDDYYASVYWNIVDRGWRYVCHNRPKHEMVIPSKKTPWEAGQWRHMAVTWGDAVRVYDNGNLVIDHPAQGLWNGRTPDLGSLQIRFGARGDDVSCFAVKDIRVSKVPLSPAEMLLEPSTRRRTDVTLLLDSLADIGPGTRKTEAAGVLHGGAAAELSDGRGHVRLFTGDARTQLNKLAADGCRTLVYHSLWTPDYGKPYTVVNADRLDRLVAGCHRAGIKLLLYVGSGLGDLAPETSVYHDYWTSLPIIRWTPVDGDERQAFSRSCTGCSHWTDFMLHHLRLSLLKHNFDGFYYDGTIGFSACLNASHGCSYTDAEGRRQPTYPLLATRRYAKRLYAISRQHRESNLIDCHTSANVLPVRAAWVDQLWNGEQFMSHKPGFHFPMDYFRSQCVGTQYGVPSMFLSYHKRPFVESEALSFTLLHDVLPRSRSTQVLRLWRIQDEFDVASARWIPYWRSGEYVQVTSDPPGRAWDEAGLASLYLHHGKRALLIVGNIQDDPATVRVRLYASRLGLDTGMRARDAERQVPVPLDGNDMKLALQGYDYRVVWLE